MDKYESRLISIEMMIMAQVGISLISLAMGVFMLAKGLGY